MLGSVELEGWFSCSEIFLLLRKIASIHMMAPTPVPEYALLTSMGPGHVWNPQTYIKANHPHMQNKINKKWVLVNAHIVQQWLFPVYTKATKTAPSCSDSIWCLCRHFLALYLPPPHIHICPGNTLGIFMTLTMVHMYWPY